MLDDHSTPPYPRSSGLRSSGSSYRFLLHTVPSPAVSLSHRLPPLAYSRPFGQPLLFRVYVLHVSDLHLLSRFITRSEMSLPTASAVAPPIRNECNAKLSGLRRDFATTSLNSRRARPYVTTFTGLPNRPHLTTLTEPPNRYEAREA